MKLFKLSDKSHTLQKLSKKITNNPTNFKYTKKSHIDYKNKPTYISEFLTTFSKSQTSVALQLTNQGTYLANAQLLSQYIVKELEKQKPARLIVKEIQNEWQRNNLNSLGGLKVQISGRLNGVDMAQLYSFKKGQIPLHTINVLVDYDQRDAYTVYGVFGVKVWLSMGSSYKKKFYPTFS